MRLLTKALLTRGFLVLGSRWLGPPIINVIVDIAESGSLKARVQARQYVGCLPNRQPAAVAKVTGTGLAAPTFT